MSDIILKAENISKQYRLGQVGLGSLGHDVNRLWHKVRGKEDPYLEIGSVNDRSAKASSDYVWALQDINFEVERGEVMGIIGKNGAGKSTLLKILSRVTAPTTGSIKTAGRIASLLEVGTGMHPELTGRENIFLNGAILGMSKAEISSKIEEIVAFSGCEMYIDTPVKRYSSGMRVRLGFAVAAFLEPDILVVDEVLAVGDAEFQKKAIGKMKDISNQGGRTVLFVSHDMAAVQNLCERALILEKGSIKAIGECKSIIDQYISETGVISHLYQSSIDDRSITEVKKIEIKTSNNSYFHDQLFDLEIIFDINCSEAILDAALSYQIINAIETPLIHELVLSTEIEFGNKPGIYQLKSRIKKLSLYPGAYRLNVYFADNKHKITYSRLISICGFEIVQTKKRDYYWGRGTAIYKEQDTSWNINFIK